MFLGVSGVSILPLGLPGGNQVDGLPPAAIRGRVQLVAKKCDYGQIRDFEEVFKENLDFFHISVHFADFVPRQIVNAEAHARGFASL